MKPQLMRPYDLDEKHLHFPCFISPKFDGVRAYRSPDGMIFRSGKPIYGISHIGRFAPVGLDGELLIPGMPFAESAGLIRSFNSTPDAYFYVFDTTADPDIFERRYYRLANTKFISSKIRIIQHTLVHDEAELLTHHEKYLAAGFEGSVVKSPNHLYRGMKDWAWMRMVPVKSVDLVVIGIYEGKGKQAGMMGGIICQGQGIKTNVGTGFDDDTRKRYWEEHSRIVGKMVKINYKEKTKAGSLRQPSFDRIRYTKE